MSNCLSQTVTCAAGRIAVTVCRGEADTLTRGVGAVVYNALNPFFSRDGGHAVFVYVDRAGSGFRIEGSLDAIDDPECGRQAYTVLTALTSEVGITLPAAVRYVLERRVFRLSFGGRRVHFL